MDEPGVEILLVEDGDADAEMIDRALRKGRLAGRLLRVRDGAEALDFVFRQGGFVHRLAGQPKLILLDLKMPRLGGLEVLRRLKAGELTRTIPIVVFTSSAEARDLAEAYRCGANSYLVKPADATRFGEVVSQAGHYWLVLNRSA
jgi:two-component system response regulator